MTLTKEDLRHVLQENFIDNPDAFTAGRRNDDMVDSMLICFALDEEWIEMYAKHADNFKNHAGDYFDQHVAHHYYRVKKWLEGKEDAGYVRGETSIMTYGINY